MVVKNFYRHGICAGKKNSSGRGAPLSKNIFLLLAKKPFFRLSHFLSRFVASGSLFQSPADYLSRTILICLYRNGERLLAVLNSISAGR